MLITPAARCQTGDDSREDTVMDLRLREAEGNEVGTTESEKKKKKRRRGRRRWSWDERRSVEGREATRGERINF